MSKRRGRQHTKAWQTKRSGRGSQSRDPAEGSGRGEVVTVNARSFETLALGVPLRFPVPPLASSIDGAEDYWWRFIEYATQIDDPATFPMFEHPIDAENRRVCLRYIETAGDLARSTALNYPASLSVQIRQGQRIRRRDLRFAAGRRGRWIDRSSSTLLLAERACKLRHRSEAITRRGSL